MFWNNINLWTNVARVVLYFDFERECVQQMWESDDHRGPGYGAVVYFGESAGNIWLIISAGVWLEISQLEVEVQGKKY